MSITSDEQKSICSVEFQLQLMIKRVASAMKTLLRTCSLAHAANQNPLGGTIHYAHKSRTNVVKDVQTHKSVEHTLIRACSLAGAHTPNHGA